LVDWKEYQGPCERCVAVGAPNVCKTRKREENQEGEEDPYKPVHKKGSREKKGLLKSRP